jgi:hypothetical protein
MSNDAELVIITRGFFNSSSFLSSYNEFIVLICLNANGLSSISLNVP